MSAGSSLPVALTQLVAVVAARPGMAGIVVSADPPVNLADLQAESGAYEAVHIDGATSELLPPVIGVPVWLDENYLLDVVVQVLAVDTQLAVTTRAAAILGEVVGAMAADPQLGATLTTEMPIFEALPQSWEQVPYWSGSGDGHACVFRLQVAVYSRIIIT